MPENKTKEIGLRIKTIRLKHHITQKQLASHIGVSQTAIALWESGQRTVPLETIDHIAEYLNVSVGYLLLGEPNESNNSNDIKKPISNDSKEAYVINKLEKLNISNQHTKINISGETEGKLYESIISKYNTLEEFADQTHIPLEVIKNVLTKGLLHSSSLDVGLITSFLRLDIEQLFKGNFEKLYYRYTSDSFKAATSNVIDTILEVCNEENASDDLKRWFQVYKQSGADDQRALFETTHQSEEYQKQQSVTVAP